MRSQARQQRQHLGLAIAMALCVLLSGAVSGAVSGSTPESIRVGPPEPEFTMTRLAYEGGSAGGFSFGRGGRNRGGAWQTDMPDAEYHLTQGIRRLTRIDTINPEKDDLVWPLRPGGPINAGELDIFNYPFVYAVEVGNWYLDEEDAAHMREYLLRGGFLMVDDFHGDVEWEGFLESMKRVFPDREIVEVPEDHEVFHVLYDLDHRVQIPGIASYGRDHQTTCERCNEGGRDPHWRGIFDDTGRLMVIINFNMDLGDAWELADDPEYPQPWTALAYRFAISYALYSMTH
ncbi:MAG: DUF4159 domain-containing protein [Steroidobacteraceae bacterium]